MDGEGIYGRRTRSERAADDLLAVRVARSPDGPKREQATRVLHRLASHVYVLFCRELPGGI